MSKFIILKGGWPSDCRVHDNKEDAIADVARLEKLRAENNARCEAHRLSGVKHRGDAFIYRFQYEPYTFKEI